MSNLFSFTGRIRRSEYFITQITASFIGSILFFVLGVGMFAGNGEGAGVSLFLMVIVYAIIFWVILASGAKRCHDRGNSGAYQLIPFYGLWMLFGDGEHGTNRYGVDPKGRVSQKDLASLQTTNA
jgi:uncharacterized membrane protein YhaH (DUF805 family)